jgi:hypothetical protein
MRDAIGVEDAPFSGCAEKPALPFIWFPWYGIFDRAALRVEAERSFEDLKEFNRTHNDVGASAFDEKGKKCL